MINIVCGKISKAKVLREAFRPVDVCGELCHCVVNLCSCFILCLAPRWRLGAFGTQWLNRLRAVDYRPVHRQQRATLFVTL